MGEGKDGVMEGFKVYSRMILMKMLGGSRRQGIDCGQTHPEADETFLFFSRKAGRCDTPTTHPPPTDTHACYIRIHII